ncbi:hypothetical protein ILYODFUR_038436 [Ilyodon furcidens]|uniref:Uncharacterized protein n=1 Tax=Ilyodon furcidens TaxID=33524 RepID=A0ABV0TQC1_9TELE
MDIMDVCEQLNIRPVVCSIRTTIGHLEKKSAAGSSEVVDFIHSFIHLLYCLFHNGSLAGAYLQQSVGERQSRPCTGRQSIAGQHRHIQDKQPCTHSFTPKGYAERPVNLTVMFLDCRRKLEYPERTHACRGEHANSMQKDLRPGFKPRTFLLQGNSATNCATMQPIVDFNPKENEGNKRFEFS